MRIGKPQRPVDAIYPLGKEFTVKDTGQKYYGGYADINNERIAVPAEQSDEWFFLHEATHILHYRTQALELSSFSGVLNGIRAKWQKRFVQTYSGGHTYSTRSDPIAAYVEGLAEFAHQFIAEYASTKIDCSTWKEIGSTEKERIEVEGNVLCRLERLAKSSSFKKVWAAQVKSKATRFDHFLKTFVEMNPEAKSLAAGWQ